MFEVRNNPQKFCDKPADVYPSNSDSLDLTINHGGFDMRSDRNIGTEKYGSLRLLQHIATTVQNGLAQVSCYYPKEVVHMDFNENGCIYVDYEMHTGTNLDKTFPNPTTFRGRRNTTLKQSVRTRTNPNAENPHAIT